MPQPQRLTDFKIDVTNTPNATRLLTVHHGGTTFQMQLTREAKTQLGLQLLSDEIPTVRHALSRHEATEPRSEQLPPATNEEST